MAELPLSLPRPVAQPWFSGMITLPIIQKFPTHPHHKHTKDQVVASLHPSIEQVLLEFRAYRDRVENQSGAGVEP